MDEAAIRRIAEIAVCEQFAGKGEYFVPVSSSNRHVHLSQNDVEALFGKGYKLTVLRSLKQPNQFACREQVTFKTAKGQLVLRVVGPARSQTQLELSLGDCVRLGISAPVRMSGDIKNSCGGTLVGDKGSVSLTQGAIVAARHLHLSVAQGRLYNLCDGDRVRLFIEGDRAAVLDNIIVRCGEAHSLECHIDTEEANACALGANAICRIEKIKNTAYLAKQSNESANKGQLHGNITPNVEPPIYALAGSVNRKTTRGAMAEPSKKHMLSEADIISFAKGGQGVMSIDKNTLLTPLARDRALQLGIEIRQI